MRENWLVTLVLLAALALGVGSAFAQTFNSGSTGADGPFSPTTNTTLALPPDGVFNFTTVNIPAGVTVTFTRNTANTPVTMLASGNVVIAGTINLSGSPGGPPVIGATVVGSNGGAGSAGGFNGGTGGDGVLSNTGGTGLGPGGGAGGTFSQSAIGGGGGGGFSGPGSAGKLGTAGGAAYGTPSLLPLIGGSGGGGGGTQPGLNGAGGGGGGGALLIASSGTITLTGTLLARGGQGGVLPNSSIGPGGGGSGGAIRIVATTLTGSGGSIDVSGGPEAAPNSSNAGGKGSAGRIRLEAFTQAVTITFPGGGPSAGQPGPVALPSGPSLRIAAVAGVPVPAAPTGSFFVPDIVIPAGTPNPMTVTLSASNIPLGTLITVKATALTQQSTTVLSAPLAGTLAASTATASLTIPTNQPSVLSASATFTLAALTGVGPIFAEGEEVERVRVASTLGGPSQVTYITRSGREVQADQLMPQH